MLNALISKKFFYFVYIFIYIFIYFSEENNELSVAWFIEKFNLLVTDQDSTYLKREDFHRIMCDTEVAYFYFYFLVE